VISGKQRDTVSTYTVVDSDNQSALIFTPDGGTTNPLLTLYRGLTYVFNVDSIYSFYVKTAYVDGTENLYSGTTNNGTKVGQVIVTIDEFTPNTLDLSTVDSVYTLYRDEAIFTKYKRRLDPLARMANIVDSSLVSFKKPLASRATIQILSSLRGIKQPEEIALMRKASQISSLGHREVMKAIHPGMKEYQAQAIMEYHFKASGSEYPGYPSIVGASENSCVLHYTTNLKQVNAGDLI
jgi:Xaa-Pro aminopeptidase